MLEALGIAEVEERVYQLVLDLPAATAAELARAGDLSSSAVHKALASLQANGLVSRTPGSTPRFSPVRPDIAVEVLILRRQEELERTRLTTSALVERFNKAMDGASSRELVEVISGKEAFAQRFIQLEQSATKELMALDKPPYVTSAPRCKEVELEALGRGVHWRSIYHRDGLAAPGRLDAVRELVDAGEEARVLASVPLKLVIADRRLGLIPLKLEPGREDAVLLHASPLLDALAMLFDTLWERAVPIRFTGNGQASSVRRESPALSPTDERVLTLMSAGFKDVAISRQLGLGLSTVERRIRRIMQQLGAETRFQAGQQAVEKGWLKQV